MVGARTMRGPTPNPSPGRGFFAVRGFAAERLTLALPGSLRAQPSDILRPSPGRGFFAVRGFAAERLTLALLGSLRS